ncbi:MAG: hypothetical protein ACT4OS_11395 [Acidimicrobiales bacterium]
MSSLVFLGLAVLLSLIGCLALWLRRRTPRSMTSHIAAFAAELDALAPRQDDPLRPRPGRTPKGRRSG